MNKLKTFFVILLLILVLGGLLVGTVYLNKIPENPAGTVGNSAGNLYNKGLFCENEGQVFFANPNDENTLYVMNSDETEFKKLTTVGVNSINAAGKYVYYHQDSVGEGSGLGYTVKTTGMYRMQKNGKGTECLKREPMLSMNLVDNDIYYQHFNDEGGLNLEKISIDKSSEGIALEGVMTPASAANGVIYYAHQEDNFNLYAYDTRTGTNSLFWQHKVYNPIYHTDGYIYFMDVENNYQLHRYNPSTGENQTLTEDRVDLFNVYDNCIYYQHSTGKNPALKRMQTDGNNPEIVMFGIFENINLTSQYAYFSEYGSSTSVYHQSLWGFIRPSIFAPPTLK